MTIAARAVTARANSYQFLIGSRSNSLWRCPSRVASCSSGLVGRSTIPHALTPRWAGRRRTLHISEGSKRSAQHDVASPTLADRQPQGLHVRNRRNCPNERGHLSLSTISNLDLYNLSETLPLTRPDRTSEILSSSRARGTSSAPAPRCVRRCIAPCTQPPPAGP
jgi:hypothetical protein